MFSVSWVQRVKYWLESMNSMKTKKMKGQFASIAPNTLQLIVAVLVVSIGTAVLGGVLATQTAGTAEYNVTEAGITGVATLNDFWAIFFLLLVLSVVLIIFGAFLGRRGRAF